MFCRTLSSIAAGLMLIAAIVLLAGCQSKNRAVVLITVSGLGDAAVTASSMPALNALPAPGRQPGLVAPAPDAVLSAASLVTGEDPPSTAQGDLYRIPSASVTLAEELHRDGFYTAAWIGYGDLSTRHGFARGFDAFQSIAYPADQPVMPDESNRLRPPQGGFLPAATVAEQFGTWLKDNRDKRRFFAWLHMGDPAHAVSASEEGTEATAYAAALLSIDAAVTYVREALRTYGNDNAVIVIVGLHGEALGDDGELTHGIALHPSTYKVATAMTGDAPAALEAGRSIATVYNRVLTAAGRSDDKPSRNSTSVTSSSAARAYGWPIGPVDGARNESQSLPSGATALLQQLRRARSVAMHDNKPSEAVAMLQAATSLAPQAPAIPLAIVRSITSLPQTERAPLQPALDAALSSLAALAGSDRARQVDLARSLMSAGRAGDALTIARRLATDSDPGIALACAEMFAEGKSIDEARPLIERVIAADGDAPELQEWLGDMLSSSGSAYQARDAYQKAAESPRARTPFLMAKWGDALRTLGDHDAALQRYAESLRLDPGYRYPHSQAAASLSAKGQENAAAQAIAQSVAATGDAVSDAIARADALVQAGMLAAAGNEIAAARAKFPDADVLPVALSRIYAKAENLARAKAVLEEFLVAHPNSAPILLQLARGEARAGNEAAAIDLLHRAEAEAGPGLTEMVRQDPAFQRVKGSALAQAAQSFTGRGEGRRGARGASTP
ncbi:MAG: sulfatase-like hydrolase/transferase [Acidobacteriota bacterium]